MKKLLIISLLLLVQLIAFSQMITVSIPTITANQGETINVPVTVVSGAGSSGTPVSACDVNIAYDNTVLTFINLVNFYPQMPAAQWVYSGNLSIMAANWFEPGFGTIAIPDGTILFEMQFTFNGGNSDLNFIKNEFYDLNYELIPTTPINGAVHSSVVTQAVTFSVDMSREQVSGTGIHLAGSFNNWSYSANPMTDNGNGIYSTTMQLDANTNYIYRFVNGMDETGLESVPASCGTMNGTTGQYDRSVDVADVDIIIDTVCFNQCGLCPPFHNVTFRVDMINQSVSSEGVHLAGTFNNWNYSSTEMTLTGAGAVYEIVLQLEEGQYIEYRFVNGNSSQDAEILPTECSNNGNRYLTVPVDDLTLNSFCFSECVECGNLPQFYNLTFRVDMQHEVVSPAGVYIAGSFQGWQPGSTTMVNSGNGIYTYSLSLLEGSSITYRFVNGNTNAGYETVPAGCSVNGNRFINNIAADTTLSLVCFSECDTCMEPQVMVTFRVDMSETIVSDEGIHLAGTFQGWDPASLAMLPGSMNIYNVSLPLTVGSYQEYRFVNGSTSVSYETVPQGCAMNDNRYFTVPANDTTLNPVCFGSCDLCPIGVKEINSGNRSRSVFPNPCPGQTSPQFVVGTSSQLTIEVVSSLGQKICQTTDRFYMPGVYNLELITGKLLKGLYFVIMMDKDTGEISKQKLIITN